MRILGGDTRLGKSYNSIVIDSIRFWHSSTYNNFTEQSTDGGTAIPERRERGRSEESKVRRKQTFGYRLQISIRAQDGVERSSC